MEYITHVSAILIRDKQILLARRVPTKRYFPDCWSCPGGKMERYDIGLSAALIREVRDGIGAIFRPEQEFGSYEITHDDVRISGHAFLGSWDGSPKPKTHETTLVRWFSFEEALLLPLAHYTKQLLQDLRNAGLL